MAMQQSGRQRRGKNSTGPKTVEGKATASQNAIGHGCCTTRLLLPDENEADWEAMKSGWLNDYNPDSPTYEGLVLKAATADWLLQRNTNRYNAAEQQNFREAGNALLWSDVQHARLQLFVRYRAAAERSFYRARAAVEQFRKAKLHEALQRERAQMQHANNPFENASEPASEPDPVAAATPVRPSPRVVAIVQNIEIDIDENAQVITRRYPSNDMVHAHYKIEPLPIRRIVYFFSVIPPQYSWICPDYADRPPKSEFHLLLPYEKWSEVAAREDASGDGHILDTNPPLLSP